MELRENVPCFAIIAWADNNTFTLYTVSLVSQRCLKVVWRNLLDICSGSDAGMEIMQMTNITAAVLSLSDD